MAKKVVKKKKKFSKKAKSRLFIAFILYGTVISMLSYKLFYNIKQIKDMKEEKTVYEGQLLKLEDEEILKTNIEITNIENKISYNKVLAKADANIKIIFITEDERIQFAQSTIPIMSFVDIENITEEHIKRIHQLLQHEKQSDIERDYGRMTGWIREIVRGAYE